VCTAADWKTILVGGLNLGGKGYYALDVTDPVHPHLLWEFTHSNLDYSYGNPRITKLKDGTWVVLVASGYALPNQSVDGLGRLFVINATTGALIRTISTGVGTSAIPSGLARISAHALSGDTDNTTTAAYGGDELGNLWRFDVNGDIGASGYDAQLMVTFQDGATPAHVQPITAKPTLATINGKTVVYVGTGRLLGTSDINGTAANYTQSFYAVVDNSNTTTFANPRSTGSGFVQQVLTSGTCPASAPLSVCIPGQSVITSTSNAVNWTSQNGWYVDFLTPGERAYTDPTLGLGTLLFTTNHPQAGSANACGDPNAAPISSFIYALDYRTGGAVVNTAGVVGTGLGAGAATRPVLIELADGTVRSLTRTSSGAATGTDQGKTIVGTPPINLGSGSGLRRVSWRELTSQ
jgi:type IV pilus assembly protein PilY1